MKSTENNDQPSDEVLRKIEAWPLDDLDGLMRFVQDNLPTFGRVWRAYNEVGQWNLATGGWSGCELIVEAMKNNKLFWAMHWYSSTRGGLYKFKR